MKNLTIFFILFQILFSCDSAKENEPLQENFSLNAGQIWLLTEMTGNTPNTTRTGEDMDWQEYYLFNSYNGKFQRTRLRDDIETTESGTFVFKEIGNEHYLELTYPTGSELKGNCTGDQIENLMFIAEDVLVGTWQACDGHGLEYVRVD